MPSRRSANDSPLLHSVAGWWALLAFFFLSLLVFGVALGPVRVPFVPSLPLRPSLTGFFEPADHQVTSVRSEEAAPRPVVTEVPEEEEQATVAAARLATPPASTAPAPIVTSPIPIAQAE